MGRRRERFRWLPALQDCRAYGPDSISAAQRQCRRPDSIGAETSKGDFVSAHEQHSRAHKPDFISVARRDVPGLMIQPISAAQADFGEQKQTPHYNNAREVEDLACWMQTLAVVAAETGGWVSRPQEKRIGWSCMEDLRYLSLS